MKGKHGEDEIAYAMGEPGAYDIQDIIAILSMLNKKKLFLLKKENILM